MKTVFEDLWVARFSFPLLLAAVLLSAGCERGGEHRILVWSSLRPVERIFMEEKLAEFGQRYPDYEFKHLFYEVEELRTNYIISAYAGKGPALIHCASDNVGPLAELELIRPLESFFQQTTLDSFMSDPFRANTVLDGHLYQIADRVGNHLALVYNKKFVPEPPRTMSELIAMGQKLTQPHDGQPPAVRYALAWNFIEPYFAMPFIGGYGGWVFDENNQPSLDNQATVRAARLIYDMANKYKIIPKESDYETANALFLDEQSAMIINGPWSWATYTTSGLDVGLAKIPMIDETGIWPAPMVSPMGYMVNINLTGEKEQITLELLHFLTSEKNQLEFARRFNLIPARVSIQQDSVLLKDPFYQPAVDQMMVGKEMPVITEMRWVWDAMRPAYQSIFPGRISPEDAARQMQMEAEKLISENR